MKKSIILNGIQFSFTKNQKTAFSNMAILRDKLSSLRSMMNLYNLYQNVKNRKDGDAGAIFIKYGINCDIDDYIDSIYNIVMDSIDKEAFLHNYESIEEEWLDGFADYVLQDKPYDGYLIPKTVSDLILMHRDHKEDYKAEIEALLSK